MKFIKAKDVEARMELDRQELAKLKDELTELKGEMKKFNEHLSKLEYTNDFLRCKILRLAYLNKQDDGEEGDCYVD